MPQVPAIIYRRPQWGSERHGGRLSATRPFSVDLPMLCWPKSCGCGQSNLLAFGQTKVGRGLDIKSTCRDEEAEDV